MSYEVIAEMEDLILSKQGLQPRELLCFELDQNEKWDTTFRVEFQGFRVQAQAARGFGQLTGGAETQPRETPGFAAIIKMGKNDFLVVGKTMRLVFQRNGYRLKAWEKGRFRDRQWVAEQPLDVPSEGGEPEISLIESPNSLDLVRLHFDKH
jgi:hypothetical protein